MDDCCNDKAAELSQLGEGRSKILKLVLLLNLGMFFIESICGFISHSTSLLADSIDMLGDAMVYAMSLYVIGRTALANTRVALFKGLVMLACGSTVITQVFIKFNSSEIPVAETIGIVGGLALVVNLVCAVLLLRYRNDDLNMRSTWLCSRNDVISNLGVLGAGAAVALTKSKYPDLIVGCLIAILVLRTAIYVLHETYKEMKKPTIHS